MLNLYRGIPITMRTPQSDQRPRTRTAVFANSKGGVGKSTLALLTCLGLATRDTLANIELIDVDPQSTSSESLKRFANERFSVINNDRMFLASGSPNNGNIVNHIDSLPRDRGQNSFLVFDSPAGNEPERSSFLQKCNIIFVPTSVSDADVSATIKYLEALRHLFHSQRAQNSEAMQPAVVILPNMVDNRDEFNELRRIFSNEPVYFGEPLYFSRLFRKAFREEFEDNNVKRLLRINQWYVDWITNLIFNSEKLRRPSTVFHQL
ncbi:MAG: hypothetical protein CMQ45_06190 [Gammaproteobacteria bacterium]|nr:hypothetical protein [Gammaproteobacteria bacterium]